MSKKNNIGRLQEVLDQIEDENIREIIRGVFRVEISYRSADRMKFPRQKIRDVIESIAKSIESQSKQLKTDEISKD